MALVGNMISEATNGNPSVVNYQMFVAVFSMLSLFYLIPATVVESIAIHPAIMVALDALNTLFFFAGGVALAASLGAHSCSSGVRVNAIRHCHKRLTSTKNYTANNGVTNGTNPNNRAKRCREAQAVTAFLWFGFVAYAVSAVLSFFQLRGNTGKAGRSSRGK